MRSTEENAGLLTSVFRSPGILLAIYISCHYNFMRRENVEFLQKQMEETPGSKMRGKTGS